MVAEASAERVLHPLEARLDIREWAFHKLRTREGAEASLE